MKSKDDPRVCGEHAPFFSVILIPPGSSPRVRGTLVPKSVSHFRRGIDPRVCGEHGIPCIQLKGKGGSSPRVRGTRAHGGSRRHASR